MAWTTGEQDWRTTADAQLGLISRRQLRGAGVDRDIVRRRIASGRWAARSPNVVSLTTGPLSRDQLMWLGTLDAGAGAMLGALTAAELAGMKNWHRDEVTVLVPYEAAVPGRIDGITFVRSRRDLASMRATRAEPPRLRIEPALLLFAARDPSERTAQGALAAAVQQRLTTPGLLRGWLPKLRPLPRSALLRQALDEMSSGAQSLAELDVTRMCRRFALARPMRQVKRRDADGRVRFTDCEWLLPDGRILVLEVDGLFHMDVEHWEDDLARQRALSATDRVMVRCSARELRDEPERVVRDLRRLGVPRAA